MKITPKLAASFLAAPGCQAVLLYGPDDGLVRDRARQLREGFLGKDADPMALVEFEESSLLSDAGKLADEIAAVSMLAPKRVILLRDAGDKLAGIIREAAPGLHADVLLIAMAGELSARSPLRSWFEADKAAAALACYRDEARDVAEVIRKRFAAAAINADRDAIDYLTSQLGNDRHVTYQELEKIITYLGGDKKLSLEAAQALVDYNRDTQLDDIVLALADKSLPQLDRMLQMHLREGTTPIAYLRALQRYFNRLYLLRAQLADGVSPESAISNLKPKVFFKQEQSLRRHVQQWGTDAIVKALALLASAELACKTSDMPIVPVSSRKLLQVTQLR